MERPRRRRRTEALRRLVREHELSPGDLIQPIFVIHGTRVEREIASMPGVYHLSVDDSLDREADRIHALGIPAVGIGVRLSKKDRRRAFAAGLRAVYERPRSWKAYLALLEKIYHAVKA